mgnify:CR=1 FL=1
MVGKNESTACCANGFIIYGIIIAWVDICLSWMRVTRLYYCGQLNFHMFNPCSGQLKLCVHFKHKLGGIRLYIQFLYGRLIFHSSIGWDAIEFLCGL